MRRTAGLPSTATTLRRDACRRRGSPPAAARTTRSAWRPPKVPKFDRVTVWPRSSAGGTGARRDIVLHRLEARRRSASSRSSTLRSTGTNRPSPVSMAMPEVDLAVHPQLAAPGVVPGVEHRLGAAAGGDRADQPDGRIAPAPQALDVGLVGEAREDRPRRRRGAMLAAIARRTPRSGLAAACAAAAARRALDIGRGDGAVRAGRRRRREVDAELVGERADGRGRAHGARARTGRAGRLRRRRDRRGRARQRADDRRRHRPPPRRRTRPVRRRPRSSRPAAPCTLRMRPGLRRGDLDDRLGGLDGETSG